MVIPFTAVILQNILFLTVSCNYHNRPPWDLKNNCDPFQFCSNKGPSNLPKLCSKNGGYPDDLTFENANYANYSQYRAALALRPCFSTERANLGFESEDDFRIIEVFTDNNIRRKQFNLNPFGEPLSNSDDQFTAVAIVFEEPESRKALIKYLR